MRLKDRQLLAIATAFFFALGLGVRGAGAQCEILRIGGGTDQELGTAIDVDETGAVVAIGAPWFPSADGVIVVYRNGVFEQELLPGPGGLAQLFGVSVGASGDRIVGAAPFYRANMSDFTFGGVWTFTHDGVAWNAEPVLRAAGADFGDQFATVVALDADRLLADVEPNGGQKRVDVYRRQGAAWVKQGELTVPEPGAAAEFGRAFAVQGDEAFVAAPVASNQLEGAVFVYEFDDGLWFHVDTLRAPRPEPDDEYGRALAVDGDVLVIGPPGRDSGAGAAHVYRRIAGVWTFEVALLNPSLTSPWTSFGEAVDVAGDTALIGAPREANTPLGGTASVFVHEAGGWTRLVKYVASDGSTSDALGTAVGIAGAAYVGAPRVDGATSNEGATYAFDILPPMSDCDDDGVDDACALAVGLVDDCNRNGIADPCDLLDGTSHDANGNGVPDECDDCNANGIPDIDDIDAGTSDDCNLNNMPDECEIDEATRGGPFFCTLGCDPDCNGNGVPDECDIDGGASNDVNADGIPDECQPDCNDNGTPDDTDIATGVSADRNGDGVPDECQTFATCEQGEILPSDGSPGSAFGIAADVSGEWAIVGAYLDDERGADAGAAYLYRRDSGVWRQETKLAPNDIGPQDRYGWSVAIDGDVAVVGSSGLDAVDVYRYDGADWIREQRLEVSSSGFVRFGWALDVSGDRLIASDPADDPVGLPPFTGSVNVYAYDEGAGSWNLETTLVPPAGLVGAQFGIDAALDGRLAIAGAFGDSTTGTIAAGSAHVYRRDGTEWSFEAALRAAEAEAFDGFGGRVDVDAASGRAIVGAFGDSGSNVVKASVFVDAETRWEEEPLPLGDPPSTDGFAHDVLILGDRAYVGDGLSNIAAEAAGATFVFAHDGGAWASADVLLPRADTAGGQRGAALALGDGRLLHGAPGLDTGRVVDIRLDSADCNRNGTCDDVDIADGTSLDRNEDGIPDECPRADIDGDGVVGFSDLSTLLADWGPCGPDPCRSDLDGDGNVGFTDLVLLLADWGASLP